MGETIGPDANLSERIDYRPDLTAPPPFVSMDVEDRAHGLLSGDCPSGFHDDYDQACLWAGVVRELLARLGEVRAGGPWVEHVEYQRAMRRERDGECICDGNPATTDGPDEFCPWHGRSYTELMEIIVELQRKLNVEADAADNAERQVRDLERG